MVKKKPLNHIFEKKTSKVLNMSDKKDPVSKRGQINDKKEIEAYLKKIKDKLSKDPEAAKKAALIISEMINGESKQKTKTKKII